MIGLYIVEKRACIALLLFLAMGNLAFAAGTQKGRASWYSTKECGGITASGQPLNDNVLTAAHKKLPIGSRVRVTNLETSKSVVVEIVDRGPFRRGRIIDLTRYAFSQIANCEQGIVRVRLDAISLGTGKYSKNKSRLVRISLGSHLWNGKDSYENPSWSGPRHFLRGSFFV